MSTSTIPRISGAGRKLLNRLGMRIVQEDGRDLRIPCVHGCGSEDNGHVDEDTGVYNCWSCQKGLSPWDLCKVVLGDHEAAKRAMIEVGLFQDLGPVNSTGRTLPAVNGKLNADESAFLDVCRLKNVPPDAWKAYGAVPDQSGVRVPMFGPDGTPCSSIHITPANGKGLYEKGKPTGLFLPERLPAAGETWLIVEGGKDAPALFALGHLAAGLPSNRITEKFVEHLSRRSRHHPYRWRQARPRWRTKNRGTTGRRRRVRPRRFLSRRHGRPRRAEARRPGRH